ncbi:MAG TPA: S41 family peptidase [Chroococcales cyanobacterium]
MKRYGKAVLVVALMVASFGVGMGVGPLKVAAETRNFTTFLQVFNLIKSEFINPNHAKTDDSNLEYGAIRGMLESLNDPYTRFMDPKAFKGMQEERQGSFSGIGIQIGMKDKHLTVVTPIEDTPAAKAGLHSGDRIDEIDGKPTKDMAIEEAVTYIRGPEGTFVTLLIQRKGTEKPFPVKIVRAAISNKAVKTRELDGNLGYIRLSTFMNENADQEIREALLKFSNKKGIVLDLRGNPGGLLPSAVTIGSMFIKSGPIVQIVDRDGEKEMLEATGRTVMASNQPLVVLVDGGSASASEILAGALLDTKRGVLIGTKTFGKGLVQTVHALEGGSGIAITTNKYLTAGGTDINKKGIVPNIVIELPKNPKGEVIMPDEKGFKDTQLDRAIQYILKGEGKIKKAA